MKNTPRFLLILLAATSLSSCLFTEPVFKEGFSKVDASLGGVWVADGEKDDPRKLEFAVCAPLDEERYMVNHPSTDKGGFYYEGRLLKVQEHTLMQLRLLASFADGLTKTDAPRYTVIWLEKEAKGTGLRVRALGGNSVKDKSPAQVKALLEAPGTDWNTLFGDAMSFRRLKDK